MDRNRPFQRHGRPGEGVGEQESNHCRAGRGEDYDDERVQRCGDVPVVGRKGEEIAQAGIEQDPQDRVDDEQAQGDEDADDGGEEQRLPQ